MRRIRLRTTALAAGLALSLGLGCVTSLKGLRFDHKLHSGEAGCADCHAGAKRPDHEACAACHEIDQKNPSDACLTCHTEGDYLVEAARPASYADVIFDHDAHADVDCARCHAGAATSTRASDSNLPGMKVCLGCHDGDEAPSDCATCHQRLRKDVRPASHSAAWPKAHAEAGRLDGESCTWCHGENACSDCHATARPKSHTPAWKNSGHGIAADLDRKACAACHRADECSRCHRTRPASHFGANFRIPLDAGQGHAGLVARRGGARSCRACHEASFCLTCHPGGF
ncbi:cytochrome c3 family protein [Deferrisoma palaeochoriense]